jgi:uncharacterized membrane protein HdeD (DUF308 family)
MESFSKSHTLKGIVISGLFQVAIGLCAILFPLLMKSVATLAFGLFFLVVGLSEVVRLSSTKDKEERLLFGILVANNLICAGMLLFHPLDTFITFTTLLALYFTIQGIIVVDLALRLRPHTLWVLPLINGLLALLFAGLVFLFISGLMFDRIAMLAGAVLLVRGVINILFVQLMKGMSQQPVPEPEPAPEASA